MLEFDLGIANFINNYIKNTILDIVMPYITSLGNHGIIWILISCTMLISKKYRKAGIILATALVICTVIGEGIIKYIVKRPRPYILFPELDLIIKQPRTYSFPSGHTASSFAALTAFIMQVENRIYIIIVALLALLITFSRLYLNVHYTSDVIAGGFLGILSALAVNRVFKRASLASIKKTAVEDAK